MKLPRGFALLCVMLALLLSACDLSSLPRTSNDTGNTIHWKRTEAQVHLYVVVDPSAAVLRPVLQQVVNESNARLNALEFHVVDSAPAPGASVVNFKGAARNGGVTSIGHYSSGHIASPVTVTIDNTGDVNTVSRKNAICHEAIGHVSGLAHGNVEGPCQGGKLTAWDVALIDAIHDHREVT